MVRPNVDGDTARILGSLLGNLHPVQLPGPWVSGPSVFRVSPGKSSSTGARLHRWVRLATNVNLRTFLEVALAPAVRTCLSADGSADRDTLEVRLRIWR